MPILAFDTETSTFPSRQHAYDHPVQPHLMQLAAVLLDDDLVEQASFSVLIKPTQKYVVAVEAFKAHGISWEKADTLGIPLHAALVLFANLRATATEVVAHNIAFDRLIMEIAYARLGKQPTKGWPIKMTCTCEGTADLVGLPPSSRMIKAGMENKHKVPNLTELHEFLFGEGFEGAHDALADVRACVRCFVDMRKKGQI
jgi:DNA polymerase III epsilon subunit-like protein